MTIKQLIVKLDKLFHNFIVQIWKPSALQLLAPLIKQVMTVTQMHHIAEFALVILQNYFFPVHAASKVLRASVCSQVMQVATS